MSKNEKAATKTRAATDLAPARNARLRDEQNRSNIRAGPTPADVEKISDTARNTKPPVMSARARYPLLVVRAQPIVATVTHPQTNSTECAVSLPLCVHGSGVCGVRIYSFVYFGSRL